MAGHFSAETYKLIRRPANLALGLTLLASLAVFGYLFTYLVAADLKEAAGAAANRPGWPGEGLARVVLPSNVLARTLSNVSSLLGAGVCLTFGAMAAGGEYGWGTLGLVLSQRSGRLGAFFGKALAMGAVLAGFCLAVLVVGAACSAAAARLLGEPAIWPSAGKIFLGVGAMWLVAAAWASLGVLLATAFRGALTGAVVGLLYAGVLEGALLTLPVRGQAVTVAGELLLGENAREVAGPFRGIALGAAPAAPALVAAGILAVYLAAFLGLAAWLFRRRDA